MEAPSVLASFQCFNLKAGLYSQNTNEIGQMLVPRAWAVSAYVKELIMLFRCWLEHADQIYQPQSLTIKETTESPAVPLDL